MGWNSLIAIQSSAFLMTLFRKGLIRWKSHAFWYGLCLVVSYLYIFKTMPLSIWPETAVVFALRVYLGMNKYLHWALYVIYKIVEKYPVDLKIL